MKKLILVFPNQRWQKYDFATTWILNPATLCQLAAMVKNDVIVKVVDANFYNLSQDQFTALLQEFCPDYVGISVLTSEYGITLDITAELVKGFNSKTIVIAGGVHATIEYEEVIKNQNIDYVVRGEGENVLQGLIKYLNGHGSLPKKGLVFRKNNKIIVQERALVEDLDSLPWPDYSLIKLEDYLNREHRKGPLSAPKFPFYQITVTRGCPFGCTFCQVASISGKKIRTRRAKNVINHLLEIKKKYHIKSLLIADDNMLADRTFFKDFLNLMIKTRINLPFIMGGVSIFLLTDEIIDLMGKAKCVGVNVAIESGNERVNKTIVKKPLDLNNVIEMIKKIKDQGIYCLGNFMIGLPGETWNEILDTIKYAEDCGVDYAKIFVAIPLKKTKLWEIAYEKEAFVQDPYNIEVNFRFGQLKGIDWTPKDVSILRAYEWDRINFGTAEKRKKMTEIWHITEQELNKIRKDTRDAINL